MPEVNLRIGDPAVVREAIKRWREHPELFVREVFGATPDIWQDETLKDFPLNPQIALSACKGPGKTTLLSWLAWNFIVTRVDAKIPVLSITGSTLADTLWSEMALWYSKSPILQNFFTMSTERILSKERPKTWWMSARSFPRNANQQQQADTLAGVHGESIMVLLDEANGMPRSVLATVQAIRSGGLPDQRIVIAGNPTNQDSALGQAVINNRQRWYVKEITGDPDDPKRSPRVDLQYARDQIAEHGADNPWVLCNIFGKFPPGGINTFLTPDQVMEAQKRHYNEHEFNGFPLIIGVDVARFGDDEIVFFLRRGKIAYPPMRMRNLDTVFVASHLSRVAREKSADSVMIDVSGSGGVYDVYRNMNMGGSHFQVQFGGDALQKDRFANKRAEIWSNMADGIKDGLALPPVPEMVHGLSTVQYSHDLKGRILIEPKDKIKARIGRSPDLEDALACTWAYPVAIMPKTISGLPESLSSIIGGKLHVSGHDEDPYERFAEEQRKQYG
jgi:phage terminase large subunit